MSVSSFCWPFPSLLFSTICMASLDNHFSFLHFFFWWMVWIMASCTVLQSSIHVSSGTCLSNLIAWIYLSFPFRSSGFAYFLQFKSEFGNKESMIWATISSLSCSCWLYSASLSSAAKNIINVILLLTIWWCLCVESSLVLLEEDVCYDQCVLLAKHC